MAFGGLLVFFGGLGVVGHQLWYWLQFGKWKKVPIWWALEKIGPPETSLGGWLAHPNSWYGLHKTLAVFSKTTPLSVTLLVVGGLIFVVFISSMDSKRLE